MAEARIARAMNLLREDADLLAADQVTFIHPCRYRRTKIGGLLDLVDVVNSFATVNVSQVVGKPDELSLYQFMTGPPSWQNTLTNASASSPFIT